MIPKVVKYLYRKKVINKSSISKCFLPLYSFAFDKMVTLSYQKRTNIRNNLANIPCLHYNI